MKNEGDNKILLVGVPRSGTTWTAEILSTAKDTCYIHEPDNTKHSFVADKIYKKLHRMPYVDENYSDIKFYNYWDKVFNKRLLPDNLTSALFLLFLSELSKKIVGKSFAFQPAFAINKKNYPTNAQRYKQFIKSWKGWYYKSKHSTRILKVNLSGLMLPYFVKNFNPKIVIVLRHPANIISSYLKLDMADADRNILQQEQLVRDYLIPYMDEINKLNKPLEKMGLQVAVHYYIWEKQSEKFDWTMIKHEDLCVEPEKKFQKLFEKLRLTWNQDSIDEINKHNNEGDGYNTYRKSSSLVNKWKKSLSLEQVEQIKKGYSVLPLKIKYEF